MHPSPLTDAVRILETFSKLTKFDGFDKVRHGMVDNRFGCRDIFNLNILIFVEEVVVLVIVEVVAAQVVVGHRGSSVFDGRNLGFDFKDVDDVDLPMSVIVVRLNVELNLKI